MSDRTSAIVSAVLLTALIAFPAASENIEYGDEESPIVEERSALNTEVSIDGAATSEASIERVDSRYFVEESHNFRIEELSTAEADLRLVVDNSSRLYTLEMPEGTLVEGVEDGREVSRFEGADRSTVSDKMDDLRGQMEDERELVKDEMTPDVEVRVTQSKTADPDQRAVLSNFDEEAVDIEGWTLYNENDESHEFDELVLTPGQQAYVYMEDNETLNVSGSSENYYIFDTGVSWNSFGDTARLENSNDVVIDIDSY